MHEVKLVTGPHRAALRSRIEELRAEGWSVAGCWWPDHRTGWAVAQLERLAKGGV